MILATRRSGRSWLVSDEVAAQLVASTSQQLRRWLTRTTPASGRCQQRGCRRRRPASAPPDARLSTPTDVREPLPPTTPPSQVPGTRPTPAAACVAAAAGGATRRDSANAPPTTGTRSSPSRPAPAPAGRARPSNCPASDPTPRRRRHHTTAADSRTRPARRDRRTRRTGRRRTRPPEDWRQCSSHLFNERATGKFQKSFRAPTGRSNSRRSTAVDGNTRLRFLPSGLMQGD